MADSLRGRVGNIGVFNRLFPQEKAYLHFDNTGYFRGETMWFSAYVVRTDRVLLSDMSRVLYVELLDPTGEVIETRKVRLDGGRGSGSIKLDRLLTSGFYEVRAYTRYMLNWDSGWAFSRVLPVFDAPKEPGDYGHPSIAVPDHRKRLPSVRQEDSVGRSALNVDFYPEGGRLVAGLGSRVAFAVTDAAFDARTIPESYILLRDVKTLPYEEIYREPDKMAAEFDVSHPVAIVENDCVIVTGNSLLQAFDRLEVMELTANSILDSQSLGSIVHISEAEIAELKTAFHLEG